MANKKKKCCAPCCNQKQDPSLSNRFYGVCSIEHLLMWRDWQKGKKELIEDSLEWVDSVLLSKGMSTQTVMDTTVIS